jgi:hypothetical protein
LEESKSANDGAEEFIQVLDDDDEQEIIQVMLQRCKKGGPTRARLVAQGEASGPQILSVDAVGQ